MPKRSLSSAPRRHDIPTTADCRADALLRTLKARPSLAKHTKNLLVLRHDRGFELRRSLGWYGYQRSTQWSSRPPLPSLHLANLQTETELPYSLWSLFEAEAPPSAGYLDPSSVVMRDILYHLPNVERLDRTNYFTDVPRDTCLEVAMRITRNIPDSRRNLTHLHEVRM
jgi:hypothetical protein